MNTLLAGSRKGLFVLERSTQPSWQITALHFAGEPVSQVLADPRDGAWYAALRLGHFGIKLHRSADRGKSWTEVASPAFPPKPLEGPWAEDTTPWTVDMIWSMAAGGPSEPGVLWAGCLPAGLFKSEDHGASWFLNAPLWHEPRRKEWFGGGYDHAGIHSVLVDPRDAAHITLGISCGGVWQTHDGGASWALTATGMKADFMPAERAFDENIQDVHRVVQCVSNPDVLWAQHHCGMYRSINAGKTWQFIEPPAPSGFGFAVASDPRDAQRAWFVPAKADSCRIPVDGQMVVTRTDDGGKSFRSAKSGLPQQHAYHLAYRHALDVSDDGTTLAMASTTGGLWVSGDAGDSWQTVSQDLPPVAVVQFAA